MTPHTLIIMNNAAARTRREWPTIQADLKQAGITFESHLTSMQGESTHVTREALANGITTIAVIGGDGTISETVEGFFDQESIAGGNPIPINANAALALLPAGTGNDLARGIDVDTSTATWTCRLIDYIRDPTTRPIKPIDVIHGKLLDSGTNFVFANVATLGIGPEVASMVSAQNSVTRVFPGEARFLLAACRALAGWRERKLSVAIDDDPPFDVSSNLIAVANSIYAGGGMMMAPDAKIDDGLLALMIAGDLGRLGIARELPRIRTGGHLANPRVHMYSCKRVRVENLTDGDPLLVEADGNLRGRTPVEFRILPASLRLIR